MSLLYWLPLNGNLNNNGLSSLSPTPSATPTYNDNGKIGKCFASGSQYISLPLENVPTFLSMCFWVKPNSPSSWTDIFSLGVNDNRMEVSTTTQYYWYCDSSSTQLIASGTALFILDNAVWNHICMTSDGTTVKFYLNGVLTKSVSQSNSLTTAFGSSLKINIGARNGGALKYSGYMNDFRIYDHCLSAKEVKEISKGLVCHYPLKSQYETGQVNKYSGDVADGYLYTGSFTRTKLEDERGYNYKLSCTGIGNDRWDALNTGSTFSFTAGKKYYYSCKVRCHSTNFGLYLRASRSENDWVTNSTNVLYPDGEWREYAVYQTINETYDRSGSTVTCNPILEFYTDNLSTSGTAYSADFDIKDVQVVESDCYVPFIDNDMVSNVVSDCSGYGNNGTKVGNIAWSGDSARYNGSYDFNGTEHIKTGFSATMNELSCSFWVKPNSQNGGYAIIASNYNNPPGGFWIAINCEGNGLWFYNGAYVKGNSLLSNDVWYHGVFTYNNGIGKWYLNGELVTTADISSRGTSLTISNLSIGNSFTGTTWDTEFYGNISDFRLYSKCLSADDVKSLYNVSASIDKTGVLSAYEFVEEG